MSTTKEIDMDYLCSDRSERQFEEIGRAVIAKIFQRRCLVDDTSGADCTSASEEEIEPHLGRVMLAVG